MARPAAKKFVVSVRLEHLARHLVVQLPHLFERQAQQTRAEGDHAACGRAHDEVEAFAHAPRARRAHHALEHHDGGQPADSAAVQAEHANRPGALGRRRVRAPEDLLTGVTERVRDAHRGGPTARARGFERVERFGLGLEIRFAPLGGEVDVVRVRLVLNLTLDFFLDVHRVPVRLRRPSRDHVLALLRAAAAETEVFAPRPSIPAVALCGRAVAPGGRTALTRRLRFRLCAFLLLLRRHRRLAPRRRRLGAHLRQPRDATRARTRSGARARRPRARSKRARLR